MNSIDYIIDVSSLNKEEKQDDFETWKDHNDLNQNLQAKASFHSS
jgi:hypothetical protein